jgi:16S rRNA (guanine(1405)-N(7))-methyltransferase
MQLPQEVLDEVIRLVRQSNKYAVVSETLVRDIAEAELKKGKNLKDSVKSTRNKIHQVGSAFQEISIPYPALKQELAKLPTLITSDETLAFITKTLRYHASTAERLPFITSFFMQTLASIQPVESILDLACGFTPLCLPWMPVSNNASYTGIDIYQDMINFLDLFFVHYNLKHSFTVGNIIEALPNEKVHVAYLLKTIPCLEQVDKTIGTKLLERIPAENILVSFPSRSLTGRSKGMAANYEAHFSQLISGKNWKVTKTEFPNEIAFLIQK